MALSNQVFISFALKDVALRDKLVEQIGKINAEKTCVDMPLKKSWESAWKEETLETVRGCDGVIGIVTESIVKADGQMWELRCAYASGLPVLLVFGKDTEDMRVRDLPELIREKDIAKWDDMVFAMFINKL